MCRREEMGRNSGFASSQSVTMVTDPKFGLPLFLEWNLRVNKSIVLTKLAFWNTPLIGFHVFNDWLKQECSHPCWCLMIKSFLWATPISFLHLSLSLDRCAPHCLDCRSDYIESLIVIWSRVFYFFCGWKTSDIKHLTVSHTQLASWLTVATPFRAELLWLSWCFVQVGQR